MATKAKKATRKSKAQRVIVRTQSAGVHYGTLAARRGTELDLADAKRVWSWQGRNTLHEISKRGVGSGSRVSEAVDSITLLNVIEIIPCADEAVRNFEAASWG
jgi:hypothetical protein